MAASARKPRYKSLSLIFVGGEKNIGFFGGGGGGQGLRPGRGVAGGEGASVGSSLEGGGAGRNRVLVQGDAAACRRKPADGVRDIFNTHA